MPWRATSGSPCPNIAAERCRVQPPCRALRLRKCRDPPAHRCRLPQIQEVPGALDDLDVEPGGEQPVRSLRQLDADAGPARGFDPVEQEPLTRYTNVMTSGTSGDRLSPLRYAQPSLTGLAS